MKSIKSFLTVAFIIISTFTYAQRPGGGQRGGHQGPPPIPNNQQIEKMVSNLADKISLTDEQETKILKLYQAHFKEVKAKTSGNNRPKREEMVALDAALEKNVKNFLTDDQKVKYETYLKSQSKRRPPRRR